MLSQNLEKPDFRREIRLGLVVYGGVSLAIYMNGVCREFYNAVRGRGIYKLLKALTDADIVVDIISGTSAGGINGVLLSYALANSDENKFIEFADFAQVWRESGDIQKLMHEPAKSLPKDNIESVLDGKEYYQTELSSAFKKGYGNKISNKVPPEGEWFSSAKELDLFVTGTDVLGCFSKIFDDTGSVIDIADHRTIFQLKHRQGRKEPFNPNFTTDNQKSAPQVTYDALAKLCRITSCFPVAFPVVAVKLKTEDQVDQKLVEWGRLDIRDLPEIPPEKDGYQLYFVDGGVLNNRPFTYTIKEMYYRTGNRPVDRKLFYIDPSPDRFEGSSKFNHMPKPDVLEVVYDSLVGLPTYQSISKDLETIKEHNEKVRRYKTILENVEKSVNYDTKSNEEQENTYLLTRIISLRDRILPLVLKMEEGNRTKSGNNKQDILEKTAKLLSQRITQPEENEKRKEILKKASQELSNLDIEYALRQHFYLIQKLCQVLEKVDKNSDLHEYIKLQLLIGKLARQVKLLEVIREALDTLLSNSHVSEFFYSLLDQGNPSNDSDPKNNEMRSQFFAQLLRLHRFLLDADWLENFSASTNQEHEQEKASLKILANLPIEAKKSQEASLKAKELEKFDLEAEVEKWLSQHQLTIFLEKCKEKIETLNKPPEFDNIRSNPKFKDGAVFSSILSKVEDASIALIKASGLEQNSKVWDFFKQLEKFDDFNPILAYFQQFYKLDQVLYPFEFLTEIKEKELIKTIRISPNDAQMGFGKNKTLDDKLAGNTLRAFGGFFKKSWRSNDLLWGRLDGLNRLVQGLVNRESIKNFPKFLERETQNPEKYLEDLLLECFPKAQAAARQEIKEQLLKLANPDYDDDLQPFLDKLVLEGQREILNTDLQNVIEDEIDEQLQWNQQRIKTTDPAKKETVTPTIEGNQKPKYQPVEGYFNQTVTNLTAMALAKESLGELSLQGKENFFSNQYNVGSEKLLKDIPTVVLLTLATRFTLVLPDIILPLLGSSRSQRIQKNLVYQIFNNLLQILYGLLQLGWLSAFQKPKFSGHQVIILGFQVFFFLIAVLGVFVTVSKSFWWVAIAAAAIVMCWLLSYVMEKSSQK